MVRQTIYRNNRERSPYHQLKQKPGFSVFPIACLRRHLILGFVAAIAGIFLSALLHLPAQSQTSPPLAGGKLRFKIGLLVPLNYPLQIWMPIGLIATLREI